MATKFYLHTATTTDTGTLPGAAASVSATSPTKIASGVNRSMDTTIGVSQTSVVLTTNAVTTAQPSLIVRFLSAPIAAQTIANQTINVLYAGSESSTNSDFRSNISLAVWRPGTGAVVGRISDLAAGQVLMNSTAEQAKTQTTIGSTSVTSQDGDILVLEIWRDSTVQSMATAYTNTIFYDGTTESSTTTNAAHLLFANDVALYTPPASSPQLWRQASTQKPYELVAQRRASWW